MSSSRDHVFGVDFSGSRYPGRNIWITKGHIHSHGFKVENSRSAVDQFDVSEKPTRDEVFGGLRDLVREWPNAVFGFDFPFSLPAPVLDDVTSWREHIEWFEARFGDMSVDEFREACVHRASAAESPSGYLRRETDWRHGGQCPYQHQLQYQTYYGQGAFLPPLISNDEARALPFQDAIPELPWLIEVYPAATLSRSGVYRQGYKRHPEAAKRRAWNVDAFRAQGISLTKDVAEKCRGNDDAHDSLAAAIGAYHAIEEGFVEYRLGDPIEGQIFR